MTTRIAVTGATGFVGRNVVQALARRKIQVVAIARTTSAPTAAETPGVTEIVASPDLFAEEPSFWQRALTGCDAVVHLAWYAEPGRYLTAIENLSCVTGSMRLAEGAVMAGVRRVVGIGTCLEYGSQAYALDIDAPLAPGTPYAAAKAATFMVLSQVLAQQQIAFAWCRLFHLFGEGEDSRRLVPYIQQCLQNGKPAQLSEGTQVRDFMDVADAGDQIARVALGRITGAVNISSGLPITVRQLAEQIAADVGRPDLLQFGARPLALSEPAMIVGVPTEIF